MATTKAKTKAAPAIKAPAKKAAPKKTTAKKTTPSTEFKVYAPNASEVILCGDFNNWDTSQYKMRKFKGDIWKKSMKLKSGRYEYRFLVDGNWWTDPENGERCQNSYGTENSVITV